MDVQLYQYHPIIGYHFTPDLKTRFEHENGGYLVRVNSAGFRSEREFSQQKEPGKFRILLFGDSYTAGVAVSNKYRYSDVLETLLPDVEVYNFGLPGSGTDQHLLAFEEIGRHYEHDLVIVAVQVENIRRIVARHRLSQTSEGEDVLIAKPYFVFDKDGNLEVRNTPVPKEPIKPEDVPAEDADFIDRGGRMFWLRTIVNKMGGRVKNIAQQVSNYQPLPEYDDRESSEWNLMRSIIEKWAESSEKPLVVMPIPLYQYIEETAPAENCRARFTELEELDNVVVHDPFEGYLKFSKSERRNFRFDTDIHPTKGHHRFLAESLSKTIEQFLPDSGKS